MSTAPRHGDSATPDPFAGFRIEGRRALVTGGDAGIGFGIATALAGAGARVAINGLSETARAAARLGPRAIGCDADIGVATDLDHLIRTVEADFGGLDILVLNAAVEFRDRWDAITPDHFDRQIDVNYRAAYRLIQAFLPEMMVRGWGRVLAIGSVQEVRPHPDMLIYASLKAAQTNMIKSLARQVAAHGVTCNVLSPGVIETERNTTVLADAAYREIVLARIPSGALGTPADSAGAALMLCSEAGRYITGVVLPVDGGMSS